VLPAEEFLSLPNAPDDTCGSFENEFMIIKPVRF